MLKMGAILTLGERLNESFCNLIKLHTSPVILHHFGVNRSRAQLPNKGVQTESHVLTHPLILRRHQEGHVTGSHAVPTRESPPVKKWVGLIIGHDSVQNESGLFRCQ